MVQYFTFRTMKEHKAVFRIGIFLAYIESAMSLWVDLRNLLRKNGFISSFLVMDYSTSPFKDIREKSFYFLKNCHTIFFVVEADVGKGGVVPELEEYKREVYPKTSERAVLFEKCSNLGIKLKEEPSSVITPNLTEEKFHIRRFLNRKDLIKLFIGAANKIFFDRFLEPHTILDLPKYRISCQTCNKNESSYMCVNRCVTDCDIYHICEKCFSSCTPKKCVNIDSFYTF